MPVYTPTLTDEPNVSGGDACFFGGISVYLEQHVAALPPHAALARPAVGCGARHPACRRPLDARPTADASASMTVSMLKGEDGLQRKEIDKLIDWLQTSRRRTSSTCRTRC